MLEEGGDTMEELAEQNSMQRLQRMKWRERTWLLLSKL